MGLGLNNESVFDIFEVVDNVVFDDKMNDVVLEAAFEVELDAAIGVVWNTPICPTGKGERFRSKLSKP